ncbi:hypothetical protein PGT21_029373 [Puccinia graminis f. sp. tritici]|uniref:Uncharacterized protein n=1 Tax=Puccinia graminis f. sp. tritici TaxID=56615 RepID=A0A5B0MIB3_PUCGR|nr:hypothetical protein PGTUg99_026147 [Puccinia graminis f. sp. tritici]KAA1091241.1 hypothetical protein PGT21_029373 [Puccinia graminis f. sp. tritici]
MSTTRDSTPCPSPRYNRRQKGRAPAERADLNLVASPGQPDLEHEASKEIIRRLEQRLNESQDLLEKLKKVHNTRQPAQTQLKVVSGSVLQTQPRIWTSPSYKRHSRMNENKMQHFEDRAKDQRERPESIGSFSTSCSTPTITRSINPSLHEDGEEQSVTSDQVDVMSTTATIATVQPTLEEVEARRIRDALLMPRVPALDASINSWRNNIA